MMKRVLRLVFVCSWVCLSMGQTQSEVGQQNVAPGTRDTVDCTKLSTSVEDMVYSTFKRNLPQRMLKEILPSLVDPFLPAQCQREVAQSRSKRQIILGRGRLSQMPPQAARPLNQMPMQAARPYPPSPFMGGMKDPGDARNPYKDLGDRPAFGARRFGFGFGGAGGGGGGGGEASGGGGGGGEGGANPWMTMMGMLNGEGTAPPPGEGAAAGEGAGAGSGHPLLQMMHQLQRGKRSADVTENEVLNRQKRANSKEDPKFGTGFGFDFLFNPRDRSSGSSSSWDATPFFNPFFNPFYNPFASIRRTNNYYDRWAPRRGVMYGDAPAYRGNSFLSSQAPVPFGQQAPMSLGLQAPMGFGLQAPMGLVRQGPVLTYSPASSILTNPLPGVQGVVGSGVGGVPTPLAVTYNVPGASLAGPQSPQVLVAAPKPVGNGPSGTAVYGDVLPSPTSSLTSSSTSPNTRVRRASSSDSSDPSPTDVISFGDFSIPTDTFNKMLERRQSYGGREPEEYKGAPPQYSRVPGGIAPQTYAPALPPASPYVQLPVYAQQQQQQNYIYNRQALQNLIYARRFGRYPFNTGRYYPAMLTQPSPPRLIKPGMALPMGAAEPLVHGNHPAYV